MAQHFKVVGDEALRTVLCTKASGTVIPKGGIVAISSGLIINGVVGSTAIAFAPKGAASGVTQVEVTVGNDFVLQGTGDAAFAVAQKGTEVDMVDDTNQYIDVGTTSTRVFKIDVSENAGTVGSASNIRVRINKPLF
jgi:hypothetical protein